MFDWKQLKIGQENLDKVRDFADKIIPDRVKDVFSDKLARTYISLGSMLVISCLYLAFVIVPIFFEISKISQETHKLNGDISLVSTRTKQLDQKVEEINKLKKELGSYSKGLPDQKEIPKFLEDLSEIARESKVKILSITPSGLKLVEDGGEGSQYYTEMPIVITAKSGYHQLGKFINNLEGGERFITIKDLRIQYDSRLPRMHNVMMTLKTYVSAGDEKQ